MRIVAAARHEVGRGHCVARIEIGVELAEAWRARLAELRMEREALEPALVAPRLDAQSPCGGGEIEIPGHGPAVVADAVQQAAHVVDKQAARSRLIDQEHHPCRLPIDVGEGGELDDVDRDDTVGRRDR